MWPNYVARQNIFAQDTEATCFSVLRLIERLLILESTFLSVRGFKQPVSISAIVEHLVTKLKVDSQLSSVLSAARSSQRSRGAGLPTLRDTAGFGNGQSNLSQTDRDMIKALTKSGEINDLQPEQILRPVQLTKQWLKGKILASEGQLDPEGTSFVLPYQLLCIVDGSVSVMLRHPAALSVCDKFCREVLLSLILRRHCCR